MALRRLVGGGSIVNTAAILVYAVLIQTALTFKYSSICRMPLSRPYPLDSQQTLAFGALTGVRSMNEIFPLERATEGYQRMISGEARFRIVLTTGN